LNGKECILEFGGIFVLDVTPFFQETAKTIAEVDAVLRVLSNVLELVL